MTDEKVSATKFADAADMSRNTILRYVAAWDRMADAGLVPARTDLRPGADIPLDHLDSDLFKKHYRDPTPSVQQGISVHPVIAAGPVDDVVLPWLELTMATFGQLEPILVWRDQIIDGYLRLLAAFGCALRHSPTFDLLAREMPAQFTERQALTFARASRLHRRWDDDAYERSVLDPLAVAVVCHDRGVRLGDDDDVRTFRLLTELRRRQPSTSLIDGYLLSKGGESVPPGGFGDMRSWETFVIGIDRETLDEQAAQVSNE
ncbi:hypothetical protein AAFP35_24265 [Gordonia sp. CPCC 206044]|uniref:hypothetical protein n=1 Tax=Gordonia sp. CPCC 206044 TaxID=3140793 RepID=UPI003AF3D550